MYTNKVELNPGPIPYQAWFEIRDKRYLIDIRKNLLIFIFPFLIYVLPLKCYEVQKDEEWIKRRPQIKFNASSGMGGIGLVVGSDAVMSFIEKINIKINISPIIWVALSIIVGIWCIKFATPQRNVREEILRVTKIKILPYEFGNTIKILFMYLFFIMFFIGTILALYQNPGNIFFS